TSAAALGLAAPKTTPAAALDAAPVAFRSSDGSVVPYAREALHGRGAQRPFAGANLSEIAFPLGGIGTGTVSLGGRGQLVDWEIFNRPGKGVTLPYTFFSIWAQAEGSPSIARVLESRLQPPYARADGLASSAQAGLPR